MIYDSGSYHHTMDWALRLGDWDGFAGPPGGRTRRRASIAALRSPIISTLRRASRASAPR